eukprot:TRINITY_DN1607_c0_g5_i1.p1 TRINITY_DN1607_c0_g5~~TRINITY_DN1607_c0_g5_i1.p1  ORF type:complete len:572 (+),score=119.60 TRINITY_DN1607_c0_g5_i1:582-2297(+)
MSLSISLLLASLLLSNVVCMALIAAPSADNYTAEALADYVPWNTLPGAEFIQDNLTYHFFAGFVDINVTSGLKYYYWFFESQNDPVNDPVSIWMNGGPGCSSMEQAMNDHGPLRVDRNAVLYQNPWAWNRLVNIIYVDQPTGVGFSYSNSSEDYIVGDKQSAENLYTFLQGFFKRFPNFQPNDFHIISQSYGGHYAPFSTYEILTRQMRINETGDVKINLKGMAVGNPFVDYVSNDIATINKFWMDGLLAKPSYDNWTVTCGTRDKWVANFDSCFNLNDLFRSELVEVLDFYSPSYPLCKFGDFASDTHVNRTWLYTYQQLLDLDQKVIYEPCDDVANYLNNATVLNAVHAHFGGTTVRWDECRGSANGMQYSNEDYLTSVVSYYPMLVGGGYGLKFMVFSGDDDSVCPTAGTEDWIFNIGLPAITFWKPWRIGNGQLAGFYTQFNHNLTFVTVRNGGHQVSETQPLTSFAMLQMYLDQTWFNATAVPDPTAAPSGAPTLSPTRQNVPNTPAASTTATSSSGSTDLPPQGAATIGIAIAVMGVAFIAFFIHIKKKNDADEKRAGGNAILLS